MPLLNLYVYFVQGRKEEQRCISINAVHKSGPCMVSGKDTNLPIFSCFVVSECGVFFLVLPPLIVSRAQFRYANILDIFMVVVGTLMAVAAGATIPSHVLLLGNVIDLFIAYNISRGTLASDATNATSGKMMEYFCNATDSSTPARLAEFLNSSDPGGLLQSKIGQFSLYYIGIASGMLIASFTSTLFWNLSAYRQSRRLRQAFFRAVMKQEIGWFDVNPSAQLNSRLSE